jgi:hypothetical protein
MAPSFLNRCKYSSKFSIRVKLPAGVPSHEIRYYCVQKSGDKSPVSKYVYRGFGVYLMNNIGSVLLHLDQLFIEREPYRSGRERTLEIEGRGLYATCVIYPMCCVLTNKAPGLCNQLSLLPSEPRTRARGERDGNTPLNWPQDLEGEGLSARDCLRDSHAICSF